MFAPFYRPIGRTLLLAFLITAVATAGGRFLALNGDTWTMAAVGATLALFAAGSSHWHGLRQLDVPARPWLYSALRALLAWSAGLAAVITAAATLMQANSPYYAWSDWFLATSGDYHHVDTDGDPYVLEGLGITAGSVVWTFVITLVVLLTAGVIGLAVGLSGGQRGLTALALGVGVALTAVILFAVGAWLGGTLPDDELAAPVRLDHLPRFLMTLAACVPPVIAALWLSRRALRN